MLLPQTQRRASALVSCGGAVPRRFSGIPLLLPRSHRTPRPQPPAACKNLSTQLTINAAGRSRFMHDLNRRLAEGFYRALASRDGSRIAFYLSDDVDWM